MIKVENKKCEVEGNKITIMSEICGLINDLYDYNYLTKKDLHYMSEALYEEIFMKGDN